MFVCYTKIHSEAQQGLLNYGIYFRNQFVRGLLPQSIRLPCGTPALQNNKLKGQPLMQEYSNYPIHALAAFNPAGQVIPRYFRLETEAHTEITLEVKRVITSELEIFCGFHRIHYFCEVAENGREPFFCEIYFNKESSKWVYGHSSLKELPKAAPKPRIPGFSSLIN